jgi:hypothetical protein
MRRVLASLAFVVLTAPALASSALAQEGAPPRPTAVITQPKAQAPAKPKTARQINVLRPSTPASRYASQVDQASQCRAQCSETRNVCVVDDGGPGGQCDSEWSRCNVRCSGTGYVFHSSAFKRSN